MRKKYPWERYPIEVRAFKGLTARAARGYTTTIWPRTTEGFYAFLATVGHAPKMVKPSIGRIDHTKGYEPGNCLWQEHYENCIDGCYTAHVANTGRKRTKAMRKRMSEAGYGRKLTKKWKLAISLGVKKARAEGRYKRRTA
jgi:hypothetical protein